jgi:hypothetical protein
MCCVPQSWSWKAVMLMTLATQQCSIYLVFLVTQIELENPAMRSTCVSHVET